MRSAGIEKLRYHIESTFGKKILSYKECAELHDDIFKRTGSLISVHTLRRVFGLVKNSHLPSATTLNVLANYCGFPSIDAVSERAAEAGETTNQNLLLYFTSLFRNTTVRDANDETFLNVVQLTVEFLTKVPELIDPLQRSIAKTENGQVFYFEQFIHIDRLNGFYGDGLVHYLAEKKTPQAQLLGNTLLAFRYWLTMEDEAFYRHYQKTRDYKPDGSYHPFVTGRYYGVELMAAALDERPVGHILKEARQYHRLIKPSIENYRHFPGFELTFAMSLVVTGEWKEALYYANQGLARQKEISNSWWWAQFRHSFLLFKAMALVHLEKQEEAHEVYLQIDPNRFYFLARRFQSILLIQLEINLKKVKSPSRQLAHLIQETGFRRLKEFTASNAEAVELNKNKQEP